MRGEWVDPEAFKHPERKKRGNGGVDKRVLSWEVNDEV